MFKNLLSKLKNPRLHTYAIFYYTKLSRRKSKMLVQEQFNIPESDFKKIIRYSPKIKNHSAFYYLKLKAKSKKDFVDKLTALKKKGNVKINIKDVRRRFNMSYW